MGEKILNETTGLATNSLANSSHTVQEIDSIANRICLSTVSYTDCFATTRILGFPRLSGYAHGLMFLVKWLNVYRQTFITWSQVLSTHHY